MKTFVITLLLAVCCTVRGGEASTNLISICLLDRPLARPWPNLDATNLHNLKPVSPPVLSDADFVVFDTTNHTFYITGAAAKHLSLTIWSLAKKDAPGWTVAPYVHDTGEFLLIPVQAPFVLQVRGEPIYAGAFDTHFSSRVVFGPVIKANKDFISTNVAASAIFGFSIELDAFPGTFDPRNDSRIISAAHSVFTKMK